MALAPKLLKQVADDIADALTTQELEGVVLAATGNGLFRVLQKYIHKGIIFFTHDHG